MLQKLNTKLRHVPNIIKQNTGNKCDRDVSRQLINSLLFILVPILKHHIR